ncbi:MAG: Zn-ribbon domain-containing OB-fold protein [Solirubrobacterales bacterium]|nr:Zn-ribbon domain-containing OB-fold protein [Solirubrobacterales bacterium]
MSTPAKPVPYPDELSDAWYEATAAGRLLIQRCGACERRQFYPRARCVHCHADALEWIEASGRGRLHSFSTVHYTPNAEFSDDVPYVFALVDLDEGVRVSTRIAGATEEELACDMPVRVVFEAQGELTLPLFEPEDR